MLVFLDTEFTDFVRPDLISIARLSEGEEVKIGQFTTYKLGDSKLWS